MKDRDMYTGSTHVQLYPLLVNRTRYKRFVIPTKSFFKIGITKYFVTTTECLVLSTKRLVAAAKFLFAAKKNIICCP